MTAEVGCVGARPLVCANHVTWTWLPIGPLSPPGEHLVEQLDSLLNVTTAEATTAPAVVSVAAFP